MLTLRLGVEVMRPQTNATLRRAFNEYNRDFFGGKLTIKTIRFGNMPDAAGWYDPDKQEIVINRCLKTWPRFTRLVVLHEMVHRKHHMTRVPMGHGKRFLKDMKWLIAHGAADTLL